MKYQLKNKTFKETVVIDHISVKEFHTDSGSSNSEESLKMAQVFSLIFIQRFTNM